MNDDAIICAYVAELLSLHGENAAGVAEEKMRKEMEKGDVKSAGVWLSVMYELTRAAS